MPVSDFLKGRIVRLEARDPYHVVVETREDRETEGSSTTIERLYEWNPGTLGARPRQLPLRGTKYDWRLSPDGRQVAYAMGKGMYYTSVDIFDLSSWENRAEIAKFTEWGQSAGQLSWSPDGQRLAMVTREGIRIVDLTMNASIDVLLSKPEDSSEKVSVLFPEWSYDGRWLAAHLYSSRSSPCVLLPGDRLDDRPLEFNKRIALIAPHIGRMKVLSVKGEHMVWSPSDNRLAVIWGGLRILSFSKAKSS
jgi:dipeptidyl aminopeptidase/acylaminoacyl peptidase